MTVTAVTQRYYRKKVHGEFDVKYQ